MRDMGSREFQLVYQQLTEPVRVIRDTVGLGVRPGRRSRTIGYFYPGDVPPTMGAQETLFPDEEVRPEDADTNTAAGHEHWDG